MRFGSRFSEIKKIKIRKSQIVEFGAVHKCVDLIDLVKGFPFSNEKKYCKIRQNLAEFFLTVDQFSRNVVELIIKLIRYLRKIVKMGC